METNASSQIENEVNYSYDAFGNKIEATTIVYATAGYVPSATTAVAKYAIDEWNPNMGGGQRRQIVRRAFLPNDREENDF